MEVLSPELYLTVSSVSFWSWAVSKNIAKKIRQRDKSCSYPNCLRGDRVCEGLGISYEECQKNSGVHHIMPASKCHETGMDPDRPDNLVLLGVVHHTLIHPSRETAREHFGIGEDDYHWRCAIPLADREDGATRQIPIHPDSRVHKELSEIAKKRTTRAKKRGFKFW